MRIWVPGCLHPFGYCDMKQNTRVGASAKGNFFWHQHHWAFALTWSHIELFLNEMSISLVMHSCEINILLFLKWKSIFRIACRPEINIWLVFELKTKLLLSWRKAWNLFWAFLWQFRVKKADYNLKLDMGGYSYDPSITLAELLCIFYDMCKNCGFGKFNCCRDFLLLHVCP